MDNFTKSMLIDILTLVTDIHEKVCDVKVETKNKLENLSKILETDNIKVSDKELRELTKLLMKKNSALPILVLNEFKQRNGSIVDNISQLQTSDRLIYRSKVEALLGRENNETR
jgi:glutaredoxin